jgi:hypothetical protein
MYRDLVLPLSLLSFILSNFKSSKGSGNVLTRSKPFGKLAQWAFSVCDSDNTGEVGKTELYCGLLLVHLNLAKYAGPAACYVSFGQQQQ